MQARLGREKAIELSLAGLVAVLVFFATFILDGGAIAEGSASGAVVAGETSSKVDVADVLVAAAAEVVTEFGLATDGAIFKGAADNAGLVAIGAAAVEATGKAAEAAAAEGFVVVAVVATSGKTMDLATEVWTDCEVNVLFPTLSKDDSDKEISLGLGVLVDLRVDTTLLGGEFAVDAILGEVDATGATSDEVSGVGDWAD